MNATLSNFVGHKISTCPQCKSMLAHRNGVALPCLECNPTPAYLEARRQHAEVLAVEARKQAAKKAWKGMSFAEYAERKANGTLPETV